VFVLSSAVVALVLIGSLAACAVGASEAELPVPTFPASAQGADGSASAEDSGLPDDCERLLPVADLGALLGLPLDSVSVRTIIGTPSPSVGRTERLTCQYVGTAAAPGLRGAALLNVNAGLYLDGASAAEHWLINVNAENGKVVLRGEVDEPSLIEDLEQRTKKVQGVREVENLLTAAK